jgi:hypothetical protein
MFETNKFLDNVWLGAKRMDSKIGFGWHDYEIVFKNWAKDYPINRSFNNCIQISAETLSKFIQMD